MFFLIKCFKYQYIQSRQKSPPIVGPNGNVKELHWSLPRLTAQEKFFVSQLITSPPSNPPKEVNFLY
jgi:hypothetical protein